MKAIAAAMMSAAIVTGCSTDRIASPRQLQLQSPQHASIGSDEFVTTGGAATEIVFKKDEVTNRLSFVAHHEFDGKVIADGQFEYTGLIGRGDVKPPECKPEEPCPPPISVVAEGRIHGVVQCFLLFGKGLTSATVEGVITQADDPKLEGMPVFWDVTDNGEGANDRPDQSSIVVLGKTGCAKPSLLAEFTVETGNVQVHPAQ